MMPPDNVDLVRRMLESLDPFRIEALQSMLDEFIDPDIDWRAVEGAIDDVGGMRGTEAIRRYMEDWLDEFDELAMRPDEVMEVGSDRVLACLRLSGRAKQSGIETELKFAVLYSIRDARLVKVREYATRAEAIEAAGFEESAMSRENVELVRGLLEAFRRRDHERAFDFYDSDIVWEDNANPVDDIRGVYHGHEGVRTYWREWLSAWRDLQFEVQDVRDEGDEVVALIRNQRQWGRHSGIETEVPPYGLVFTFRSGKVVRWRSFPDQATALAAVGLSE